MSRTAFEQTIEGKFEKEVSFGGCKGASMWRFDYIFSSSGRMDWTNAWLTSPVLGICLNCVAIATRSLSSMGEMTGAKQSLELQLWGFSI